MAGQIIIQKLDASEQADRILDEFESRTGLRGDVEDDARYYELHDEEHRKQIVQTLTDIDPGWTDHLGFRLPA